MASGEELTQAGAAPEDDHGSLKRPREDEGESAPKEKAAKEQNPEARGLQVRVVNLKADEVEFNGRIGILEEFNGRSWRVCLLPNEPVRVKPKNLELLHLPAAGAATSDQSKESVGSLSLEALEAMNVAAQKLLLCEALYPFVVRLELDDAASTMLQLLETPSSALWSFLRSEDDLQNKVMELLQSNTGDALQRTRMPMRSSEDTSQETSHLETLAGLATSENSSVCSGISKRKKIHIPPSLSGSGMKVDWRTCTVASLKRTLGEAGISNISSSVLFNAGIYERRDEAAKDVMTFLLKQKGLDVNVQSSKSFNQTPLFYVARHGCTFVASLLISQQAQVNAKDANHETPLFYASRYNSPKMVSYLVKEKALVDVLGNSRTTPLLYASKYNASNVQTLLSHRADPNIGDRHGRAPLHYCKDVQAIKALAAAGANGNAKDASGDTPLQYHVRVETEKEPPVELIEALLPVTSIGEQSEVIMKFAR